MNRDKQICEMVKDICKIEKPCKECSAYPDACKAARYAERFYNAGYRRATDVAMEIFEEIEDALDNLDTYGCTEEGCDACVTFEDVRRLLERLKKKYESEGADDGLE